MSQNFQAKQAGSVTVTATTASAAASLGSRPTAVRVYNASAQTVFIEFGNSAVTATVAASIPVPAGAVEVFEKGEATHVATIVAATTGVLYFTPGTGV